jgi:hypothetical protein
MGIDVGKNSFHLVDFDQRGSIVLRQKWSRGQLEARLANMPPSPIGVETCVGAHHLEARGRHRQDLMMAHTRVLRQGQCFWRGSHCHYTHVGPNKSAGNRA